MVLLQPPIFTDNPDDLIQTSFMKQEDDFLFFFLKLSVSKQYPYIKVLPAQRRTGEAAPNLWL